MIIWSCCSWTYVMPSSCLPLNEKQYGTYEIRKQKVKDKLKVTSQHREGSHRRAREYRTRSQVASHSHVESRPSRSYRGVTVSPSDIRIPLPRTNLAIIPSNIKFKAHKTLSNVFSLNNLMPRCYI